LSSMYWSLDELMRGNWAVIPIYVLGNLVGKYIGMKIDAFKNIPLSFFSSE